MVSTKMGRPNLQPGWLPAENLGMLTWALPSVHFCGLYLPLTRSHSQFPRFLPLGKWGSGWVYVAGSSPEKYLPESTGAGCAFLDYDNDGWMDIYLVNSGAV